MYEPLDVTLRRDEIDHLVRNCFGRATGGAMIGVRSRFDNLSQTYQPRALPAIVRTSGSAVYSSSMGEAGLWAGVTRCRHGGSCFLVNDRSAESLHAGILRASVVLKRGEFRDLRQQLRKKNMSANGRASVAR